MSHMTMGDEIHALRCDRASLLRELEELQAERDAAVEQVVYWRELEKVKAERDALARMQKFVLILHLIVAWRTRMTASSGRGIGTLKGTDESMDMVGR